MKCDHANSSVSETRHRGGRIWRRRYCLDCMESFSTVEVPSDLFESLQERVKRFGALRLLLQEALNPKETK